MIEAEVSRQYDIWFRGGSLSGRGYRFLASVQGMMLVNTPVFRLDRELGLKRDQRLLDVGCGRASLLQVLEAKVHFRSPPVGIDLSTEMLAVAAEEVRRQGLGIGLARGSALRLPLASDSFGVVTCSYLVKHLGASELLRFFRELHRVLKPGGVALIWEFAPTSSRLLESWHRWLLTRGVESCQLRSAAALTAVAIGAGFDWVKNASLRPFLFPPIPRASLIMGKAPEAWRQRTGPGRALRAGRGFHAVTSVSTSRTRAVASD